MSINKNIKLLVILIFALIIFFYLEKSNDLNHWQIKIDKYSPKRGFQFLLLRNIMKYFFLILGIVSSWFVIKGNFINKQ